MDREHARSLLGLPPAFDVEAVEAAFRRQARCAHPDHGGDAEHFKELVESRRSLLAEPARADASVTVGDDPYHLRRLVSWLQGLRNPKPERG